MLPRVKTTRERRYDRFLLNTLGRYLPDCLTQVTQNKPKDPIEYISSWLYKAYDSDFYFQEKEKYLRDIDYNLKLIEEEEREKQARLEPLLQAIEEEKLRFIRAEKEERDALWAYMQVADDVDPAIRARFAQLEKEYGTDDMPLDQFEAKPAGGMEEGEGPEDGEGGVTDIGLVGDEDRGRSGSITPRKRSSAASRRMTAGSFAEDGTVSPGRRRRSTREEPHGLTMSSSRESVGSTGSLRGKRSRAQHGTLPPIDHKGKKKHSKAEAEDEEGRTKLPAIGGKGKKKRKTPEEAAEEAERAKLLGRLKGSKGAAGKLPRIGVHGMSSEDYLSGFPPDSVQLTTKGNVVYISSDLGLIAPVSIRYKKLKPNDDPEQWEKRDFRCESHYDHELYTWCNVYVAAHDQTGLPPMTMEEFLTPVNRLRTDSSDFDS